MKNLEKKKFMLVHSAIPDERYRTLIRIPMEKAIPRSMHTFGTRVMSLESIHTESKVITGTDTITLIPLTMAACKERFTQIAKVKEKKTPTIFVDSGIT